MLNQNQIFFNEDHPLKKAEEDIAKDSEIETTKLENLIQNSDKVLLKISSFFPLDLFPDEVSIDLNQVNIYFGQFFFSGRRHSIALRDIEDVFVDMGPFFAKLCIVDRGFVENVVVVNWLKKEDAKKARRVIQGLIIAAKQWIDLTKVEDNLLLQRIEEIGASSDMD